MRQNNRNPEGSHPVGAIPALLLLRVPHRVHFRRRALALRLLGTIADEDIFEMGSHSRGNLGAIIAEGLVVCQRLRFSCFPEDGDAKEVPVPQDLNSQSRGTGTSFAGNNNLPEKKPSACF